MAPPRSGLALGVLGIFVGIALHGCGGLTEHINKAIQAACANSVSGIINQGKSHYYEQVKARCQQLADQAKDSLLNEEKGDQLFQHCIETAGATLNETKEEEKDNFTQECIAKFQGLNGSLALNPLTAIQEWLNGTDFSGAFQDAFDQHLGNHSLTLDELKKQFPDDFLDGAEETSGNDASTTAEDTSGNDASTTASDGAEDTSGNTSQDNASDAGASDAGASDAGSGDASDAVTANASEDSDRLRLFDVAVRLPHSPKSGYAVLSCLLGCALAAAVGLAVVLRRRKARVSDHVSLITAEDSE